MRFFNAFQLVALFAAMPFVLSWLHSAPFQYAGVAKWTAAVVYLVAFIVMTCCVRYGMEKGGPLDF